MVNRWGNNGNSERLYFGGSKITADGHWSHEIKICLLLGKKAMTNLYSILKSRDITIPTKVHLLKALVFPVAIYGYESWTIKKAEHQTIDASELWCWRKLWRVPWTARRSNQSQWTQKKIYMYPFSPKLPSYPGCHRTLSRIPWVFVGYPFWIQQCVQVHPKLPKYPLPPFFTTGNRKFILCEFIFVL